MPFVLARDFVKYVVIREMRDGERDDAARRLGFPVASKPDVAHLVLSHLGIGATLPSRLSFSDQARFAEETIRRRCANGRIWQNIYG